MSRTLRSLAVLAMIALISEGCSNAPAETGTGSSGGNTNAATGHEAAVQSLLARTANPEAPHEGT